MAGTITTEKPAWQQMNDLCKELTEFKANGIYRLRDMAMAYVWGWQDGRDDDTDSLEAGRFADAYGLHAARYSANRVGYCTNIPRAWRRWQRGETIED